MKNWKLALIACAAFATALVGLASSSGAPAVTSASAPAAALHGTNAGDDATLASCPHCCPPWICPANGPSLDGNAEYEDAGSPESR